MSDTNTPRDEIIEIDNSNTNEILNRLELENREEISKVEEDYKYLYPSLDDSEFNIKIATRKEFSDTKYVGKRLDKEIEEVSDEICNAEFELAPHQMFVRNFMSFQTPYNGLLLYHGLGSGKTCSAISVAEEMRDYMKQVGISKRIIVVASPNVQSNFKKQLFDENQLDEKEWKKTGVWNIRACTGNKFLSEINPMNMKGLTKQKVVSQVKRIINTSYLFLGYIEFANYIRKKSEIGSDISAEKREKLVKLKLNRFFSNRLIIIDEVHNIRMTDDNKDKRVAVELTKLVENVPNLRLLLLSATPMYNTYKEVIWLINLLNSNDRRSIMSARDVFNGDGSFKISSEGEPIGRNLLARKATGYVSFVRGENPYTFPFRIWPDMFSPQNTFLSNPKPTLQLNGKPIVQPIQMLSLYLTNVGEYQQMGYNYIIEKLKAGDFGGNKQMPSFENMEAFGYTLLQRPLEALNMIFPDDRLTTDGSELDARELVGKEGMSRIMKYKETSVFKGDYEYKNDTYGNIFSLGEIGKYSGKIKNICESVKNSEGVVLVYSQYIEGGLVPIALALEEMGLIRAGGRKSLFKTKPTETVDALTMKPKSEVTKDFSAASYIMISGDKLLSPNNKEDVDLATNPDNFDGSKVKVILISQAGSEGLDFKFIRQVHILDPWYNMNRIEQIIGRAVRTCSHKLLPFLMRNVELYLYGSLVENQREEAADLYVYRLAELKSIQIGAVSRLLKEVSVDCLLNYEQTGFTVSDMNRTVSQKLSTGQVIEYQVGDRPFSSTCDYQEKCSYKCMPSANITEEDITYDTYNENFIMMNVDKITSRIRQLFIERFYYKKERMIMEINAVKNYPIIQINAALTQLIDDKNEYISDKFGRLGRLINIGDLYLFQPLELTDPNISIYDRSVPVQYKRNKLVFDVPKEVTEAVIKIDKKKGKKAAARSPGANIISTMQTNFDLTQTPQQLEAKADNWYQFCSLAIPVLLSKDFDRTIVNKMVIHHMIESLRFSETLDLINFIESKDDMTPLESIVNEYFKSLEMSNNDVTGILLQENGKQKLIVANKATPRIWSVAQPLDYEDLRDNISEIVTSIIPMREKLNTIIGFMVLFKKSYMVFKMRDVSKSRNTGARCDQGSKIGAIQKLNSIAGDEIYSRKAKESQLEICVVTELMMRIFDKTRKNNKRWFLTPGEASVVNKSDIEY